VALANKTPGRPRPADAGRDGVGTPPARGMLVPGSKTPPHRPTAASLHRHHARALLADEADGFELGKCLPHADQAGAAAGRIEDDIGHLPAELLDKLESHRLLALDAIRLLERRGVEPADLGLAFADDLAAVIDQPIHAID